ncbi:uncharacterized protein TNIN_12421 [Trichonephila inaurata madagascariensis]|uniref:MICOS complex subunit MIC10 n=1 Tax=Trichonephila inaurata madagascariensis TaxID=2747483 RepID=A0A8X6X002_9ARAC|nr:uncharacterized protein TNIN_12421 [Trichonephila inaurata madagascariensis]
MSSKSEDIVGETWDYCFADSLIKVGSGLAVGSVLSLVMFKRKLFEMSLTSTELPKWEMFWEFLQNRTQILENLHGVQGPPLKLKTPSENIQNSAEGSSSNALVTQPAPLLAPPSLMPDAVINNPSEPQTIQTFSSLNKSSNKFVFLSTAIVGIWSPVLNSYVRGRVILDSASQSHFMTLQFASKLGLEKKKVNLAVSGLNENSINIKWKKNNAFISNDSS